MSQSYQVTFPQALSHDHSTACIVQDAGDDLAVVTQSTPFHPVDPVWPDQPEDRGWITCNNQKISVKACLTGAICSDTGKLFVGSEIPVRKGDERWQFVVVHMIDNSHATQEAVQPGAPVELTIDVPYQNSLSLGHTACHLSALALNKTVREFWRKDPGRYDALGNPDLDQLTIVSSSIQPRGSRDHYRLGKSIRKKGLQTRELIEDLPNQFPKVEQQVNQWLSLGTNIHMEVQGNGLTDRRYWHCDLGDSGKVVIPCGGTHATNLSQLRQAQLSYEIVNEQEFIMVTKVLPT